MNKVLERLKEEREMRLKGCLYHYTQVKFAYNTNRIEGSQLTEDQTRYIYETYTISTGDNKSAKVDDIIETVNHFSCFDYLVKIAEKPLSEEIIKEFHSILKRGTSDSFKDWFNIGAYKLMENYVGGLKTSLPSEVKKDMNNLLMKYLKGNIDLNKIIDFHYNFERIHPFQDGNGRVGRLIMFKECLKNNIIPFIIEDKSKQFYYMGLKEYPKSKLRLIDTCLHSQDIYKEAIEYLNIDKYNNNDTGNVKYENIDKLLKKIKIPNLNNKKEKMVCYKYDIKNEKVIDFRGNEIYIESTEVISSKKNICKLICKDKNENNVFLLQRTRKNKTEMWYFNDNFSDESSIEFISQFDFEMKKKKQINNSNKNGKSNGGKK